MMPGRRRGAPLLLLIAAAVWPIAALSQPFAELPSLPKPLSFGTSHEFVETAVVIPRAAALETGLLHHLQRAAERHEQEFVQSAKADHQSFGQEEFWRPYSLQIDIEEHLVSEPFISPLVTAWFYTGGAHGNLGYEGVTWDRERDRPIGLADLLKDANSGSPALEALARHVRRELALQKADLYREMGEPAPDAETDEWISAVTADPEILSVFTLVPAREKGRVAGIMIHFPPYAVGPYAEGPFHVFAPASLLAPFLSDRYRPFFGGEPASLQRLGTYDGSGAFLLLSTPRENATVGSPLEIAGEAPDYWFFEATAPVRLETLDGKAVAMGYITADPTSPVSESAAGLVAFSGDLPFPAPSEPLEAILVFTQHDPSDGDDPSEVALTLRLMPQ